MKEHLTYLPEPEDRTGKILQVLREFIFSLLYPFLYVFGLIFPLRPLLGEKRPVVLIPGFMGSGWYLYFLRRALFQRGYTVYTPNFGFQMGDIKAKALVLENFLEKNKLEDCYLIGHSMGGLIALQMGYRGRDRVRKLFLANVPLKGSYLAILALFCKAGWQMLPFSVFIKDIQRRFTTFVNTQTIFSFFDQVVFPVEFLHLGRFDDVEFAEIGHLNLVMGKNGIRCLVDLVELEEKKARDSTAPISPKKESDKMKAKKRKIRK